jgi:hypothetical protein
LKPKVLSLEVGLVARESGACFEEERWVKVCVSVIARFCDPGELLVPL